MPDKKTFIEELNYLSSHISTIVRTLNFGILVFIWSLLFTTIDSLMEKISSVSICLMWIAIIVVASLSFDFFQYVVAYFNTIKYQKKLDPKEEGSVIKIDDSEFLYKMRHFFFYGKQLLTVFGVAGLFFVLIKIVS